jgi:predicted small lipoprotein YifL
MTRNSLSAITLLVCLCLCIAGCGQKNQAPSVSPVAELIVPAGQTKTIAVVVHDPENDPVTCVWAAALGTIPGGVHTCTQVEYTAPGEVTNDVITITVDDRNGNVVQERINVAVVEAPPTPTPTAIPTPTETPLPPGPSVTITRPEIMLTCENPSTEDNCRFAVTGTGYSGETTEVLRIYTFVFPVDPPGAGWYRQLPATSISSDGSWLQPTNYLGAAGIPALEGHTLRIRAALVEPGAAYRGKPLDQGDLLVVELIEDIDGLVAVSDEVFLTVGPR